MSNERRILTGGDIRCMTAGKAMRISGMAARYNSPTKISGAKGRFVERLMRGAFSRAINERQDVALLINHDMNRLMARVSSGTLRLHDSEDGLAFDADLPDSEDARNAYASIQRGDMHGCSFGFGECDSDWDMTEDPEDRTRKMARRTIRDIHQLMDVSPTTFPAYEETSVTARSIEQRSEIVVPDAFIVIPEPVVDSEATRARRRRVLDIVARY